MKDKRCLIIVISLAVVFFFIFAEKNNKIFKIDGVQYAVTVNGKVDNKFPPKGPYKVDLVCEGGTGVWNYEEWVAEIYDVEEGNVYCNLSFTNENATKLNDYIINLLNGSTSVSASTKTPSDGSTLEKITEHNEEDYRYRGIDPNNYIMFNGELWRIIGVFDEKTHGITNTHLVKIIRKDSIGSYAFAAGNGTYAGGTTNNYPESDIYQILNTAYYNSLDVTGEEYCEFYGDVIGDLPNGNCNFNRIGLKNNYQNMIESGVNWFLGGYSTLNSTSAEIYNFERGSEKYTKNVLSTREAGLTTPIGLMYASDYGYASPSSCTNDISNYDNTVECAGKNWLNSNYYEWTITHDSKTFNYVYTIHLNSPYILNEHIYRVSYSGATRPTLYLKPNVYYLSGTGTQIDPYIIGM